MHVPGRGGKHSASECQEAGQADSDSDPSTPCEDCAAGAVAAAARATCVACPAGTHAPGSNKCAAPDGMTGYEYMTGLEVASRTATRTAIPAGAQTARWRQTDSVWTRKAAGTRATPTL